MTHLASLFFVTFLSFPPSLPRYDWTDYPILNASAGSYEEHAFDQEGFKNATITGVKAHQNGAAGIPDLYLTVRYKKSTHV